MKLLKFSVTALLALGMAFLGGCSDDDGIDNRDDTGHFIMRGLIEAAKKPPGEGFSRYRWYRPDQPKALCLGFLFLLNGNIF